MTDDDLKLNKAAVKLLDCEIISKNNLYITDNRDLCEILKGNNFYLEDTHFHDSDDWVRLLIFECEKRKKLIKLYTTIEDIMELDGEGLKDRAIILLASTRIKATACLKVLNA